MENKRWKKTLLKSFALISRYFLVLDVVPVLHNKCTTIYLLQNNIMSSIILKPVTFHLNSLLLRSREKKTHSFSVTYSWRKAWCILCYATNCTVVRVGKCRMRLWANVTLLTLFLPPVSLPNSFNPPIVSGRSHGLPLPMFANAVASAVGIGHGRIYTVESVGPVSKCMGFIRHCIQE